MKNNTKILFIFN